MSTSSASSPLSQKKLAVIVPISADTIAAPRTINDIRTVLRSFRMPFTLVIVRNGQVKSHMSEYLDAICFSEASIHCVTLCSLTSQQLAIRAGFDAVEADAYITLSADGTDDIRAIAQMVRKWHKGSECVLAVREEASETSRPRRLVRAFYRATARRCSVPVAYGAADFCLLDKRVVDVLRGVPADHRTLAQQTARLGFRRAIVGMEASWRRPESLMQRGVNHFRSLRESLISHSRTPVHALYWTAASVVSMAAVSTLSATAALMAGVSMATIACGLLLTCIAALGSISVGLIVLGEYLYRLMQNGPAAQSYAVETSLAQTCQLPTTPVRRTLSEAEILNELHSLRDDLLIPSQKPVVGSLERIEL